MWLFGWLVFNECWDNLSGASLGRGGVHHIGLVTSKCCHNSSGVSWRRGGVHWYWVCWTISVGGVSQTGVGCTCIEGAYLVQYIYRYSC